MPDSVSVFSIPSTDVKPCAERRVMYARFLGSEAPVAEQYTTRASGTARCSATTASAVLVGIPLSFTRFFALWHSSKTIKGPRGSCLSQRTSCSSLLPFFMSSVSRSAPSLPRSATFPLPCMSNEYVQNTTPLVVISLRSPFGIDPLPLGNTSTRGASRPRSRRSRSASNLRSPLTDIHSALDPPPRACE